MRATEHETLHGAGVAIPVLVLVALLGALPAFGGQPENVPLAEGAGPAIGSANPAAVYCTELGYEYVIVDTPEGQRGVVVLPNGERCDAWDFYRGKCGQEYSYCAREGYGIVTKEVTNGSFTTECAVCVSRDGEELGTVSDLMGLEAKTIRGIYRPVQSEEPGPPSPVRAPVRDLPSYFDWRDSGGCTSIKDQASCGSCWAFGTAAALECNILIKDGVEEDLSEQWLLSCNQEGYTCSGGWWVHEYFQYATDPCGGSGAVLERAFPYTATDAPCN
jgi:putative hemolysin